MYLHSYTTDKKHVSRKCCIHKNTATHTLVYLSIYLSINLFIYLCVCVYILQWHPVLCLLSSPSSVLRDVPPAAPLAMEPRQQLDHVLAEFASAEGVERPVPRGAGHKEPPS